MYEEMVERLRNNADHYMTVEGAAGLVHLIIDAADAIETLSKQVELEHQSGFADGQIAANRKKSNWIPVTERMPEKRIWVLCRCVADIIEVLRWENNEWYRDPMHVYYPSFVTHWQKLPDSPKEDKPDVQSEI